jgi:hypothetical protein
MKIWLSVFTILGMISAVCYYERHCLMTMEEAREKVVSLNADNYGCGRWTVAYKPLSEGRPQYDLSGCGASEAAFYNAPQWIEDVNLEIYRAHTLTELYGAIATMHYMIAKAALRDPRNTSVKGLDEVLSRRGRN